MKALSIRQPWAWCILNLPPKYRKDIENRTWKTKFRGKFVVHAGKQVDKDGVKRIKKYLKRLGYKGSVPDKFETGALLGTVELVDCVSKHKSVWFEGEYGFVLKDPKPFEEIIPYKGQLNFFNVEI